MPTSKSTSGEAHRVYYFRDFTLDLDRGALLREGADVKLRPKSFDMLKFLVARHGRLVTKDELLDAIWGRTVVTEDSVTHCLIDIRKALGDRSQKIIRTVPRRGYIFDVPVSQEPSRFARSDQPFGRMPSRDWRLTLGVSLVLAIAAFWWWQENRHADEPAASGEQFAVVPNSIAVLAFDACADDETEIVLAMGLSMDVTNRLAQHPDLKVLSSTSTFTFAGYGLPLEEIARPLRVEYLLTGVVCRAGGTLVVSAELHSHDGLFVWGNTFEQRVSPSDVTRQTLAIQLENAVASQLGERLVAEELVPVNSHAYEQFLIGQEYHRRGEIDKALAAYEYAVQLQPDYAEAFWEKTMLQMRSARTDDNWRDSMQQARTAAEEALDLAQQRLRQNPQGYYANRVAGQVYHSLGYLETELSYREFYEIGPTGISERLDKAQSYFANAEQHYRLAIAASPSDTHTRVALARVLSRQGTKRHKEILEILQIGLQLEPFNAELVEEIAIRLTDFGRVREAMEQIDRFESLPGGKQDLWWVQLEILHNAGMVDKKFAYLIDMLANDPQAFQDLMTLGHLWWAPHEIVYIGLYDEAEDLYNKVDNIPDPQGDSNSLMFAGRTVRQFALEDSYLRATGRGDEVARRGIKDLEGLSVEEILKYFHVSAATYAMEYWAVRDSERAVAILEALRHYPYHPFWTGRRMAYAQALARIYIQTGRMANAIPILEEIVSNLQSDVDVGVRAPETLMRLASAYGWLGGTDAALEMLDLAVDYGAFDMKLCCEDYVPALAAEFAGETAWWQGLENDRKFVRARSRMRALVDEERSNVRALFAQNDIAQLLQPLIIADARTDE